MQGRPDGCLRIKPLALGMYVMNCSACGRIVAVTGAASVLACLAGCGGAPPQAKPALPRVETSTASVQPISQIISGDGELFAYKQASLSPKISSPISRYYVRLGDHVHAGQLLATLEHADLEAALTNARGAVAQAQANYAETTASGVPQELQKAQSDVTNAKANLDEQQKLYNSETVLYRQGAIAERDVNQSAVALTAAKTQYSGAVKRLDELKATVAGATEKSAAGNLESARAKEKAAEAQLGYSELRSPIDGVIAYRNLYPGQIVAAGTTLITVMDVSRVIARLHLTESDVEQLKLGDAATIQAPGLPADVPGKVTVLGPALDPNSTTREVWVQAKNPNSELHPGDSVHVNIVARVIQDAVVVPESALNAGANGGTRVEVLQPGNTVESRKVQVGVRQGDRAQIISGIAPGETVVSNGGYGLPDGTKVAPPPGKSASGAATGAARER